MNLSEIGDPEAFAITAALMTIVLKSGNVDDFKQLRESITIDPEKFAPLVTKYWDEMVSLVASLKTV